MFASAEHQQGHLFLKAAALQFSAQVQVRVLRWLVIQVGSLSRLSCRWYRKSAKIIMP
jgi:hypothetical protein